MGRFMSRQRRTISTLNILNPNLVQPQDLISSRNKNRRFKGMLKELSFVKRKCGRFVYLGWPRHFFRNIRELIIKNW